MTIFFNFTSKAWLDFYNNVLKPLLVLETRMYNSYNIVELKNKMVLLFDH